MHITITHNRFLPCAGIRVNGVETDEQALYAIGMVKPHYPVPALYMTVIQTEKPRHAIVITEGYMFFVY